MTNRIWISPPQKKTGASLRFTGWWCDTHPAANLCLSYRSRKIWVASLVLNLSSIPWASRIPLTLLSSKQSWMKLYIFFNSGENMHQQPFSDLFLYAGFVYDVFFGFFPARHFFQLAKTSGEVVEGGGIEARTSVWLDKQWCLKKLTLLLRGKPTAKTVILQNWGLYAQWRFAIFGCNSWNLMLLHLKNSFFVCLAALNVQGMLATIGFVAEQYVQFPGFPAAEAQVRGKTGTG